MVYGHTYAFDHSCLDQPVTSFLHNMLDDAIVPFRVG